MGDKKDAKKIGRTKRVSENTSVGQLTHTSELLAEDPQEEVQFTETSYTSASFESLPPAPVQDTHKNDVLWLKNNTEPWEDVIKKWKSTYELRQLTEYESVSQLIEYWPILNDVRSDVLIHLDFDALHPEKSHKFYLFWTEFIDKIKSIKLYQTSKDDTGELVKYIDGLADEEHKLPSQIELLCKLVPPKGRLNRREKFSMLECTESFFINVKTPGDIQKKIEDTIHTASLKRQKVQPYIIHCETEDDVGDVKSKKKKGKKEEQKRNESELFQWSDESFPIVEEQQKEEVQEKKEKKKGKKGKKDQPTKEILPDFEKPKNWKKMNKKEQDKWMAERVERYHAEQEAEKQRKIAGAKEKKAADARLRAEKMAKDNEEQDIRRDILEKTCALFRKFEKQHFKYENDKHLQDEWSQYLSCDGLPDPRVVTQMATYLHVWRERGLYDDEELERRCEQALPMLEMLEEFVANSRQYTPAQAANYNEVRLQLREQLAYTIEFASYWLLRDIEHRLVNESVQLATYQKHFKGLKLNLWCVIKMPTKLPLPVHLEKEKTQIELAFPAIKVEVTLPKTIDSSALCVRASRSLVDLVSERSKSYAMPAQLADKYEDLFIFNVKEHAELGKIKKEQDVVRSAFYKQLRERTKELETFIKTNIYAKIDKEKEELENLYLSEAPFMPEPRDQVATQNEVNFRKFLKTCNIRVRPGEINLRKYRICGGILNLDLLTTPPQPKNMVQLGITLTTLEVPAALKPLDYKVKYRAPKPAPPGQQRSPEEIEAEMKRIEAEFEKLAMVFIELPQEIMWNEPPIVCQWQEQRRLWSSNYINDFKYNEDKLTAQFRTGVLWPIGIATLKHSNLPYQGWEMKPDPNSKGVLISVIGAGVTVNFACVRGRVMIKFIANSPTAALKEHFNKKYTVKKLVQIMREAACDFFPDFDAHNYVEGSCPKEWAMERHTYHAMAMLSRAYNFQWSRWNASAGYRNMVMQFREQLDPKREGKLCLLHITPQRATVLKTNEMNMQELSLEPMNGIEFFPDLFTLNMQYGSVDARRQAFNMDYKLVETVFGLLQELKIDSFS